METTEITAHDFLSGEKKVSINPNPLQFYHRESDHRVVSFNHGHGNMIIAIGVRNTDLFNAFIHKLRDIQLVFFWFKQKE